MPSREGVGAGELRSRVTIESKTPTADSQLGRAQVWGTFATVWAAVRPLSAVERLQTQAMGSQVAWRVTIRYRADVTPQMRLSWTPYGASAAKSLEIHGVTMRDGEPFFLDLDCGEGPV